MRTAEQEIRWLISHEVKSVRFHLGSGIVPDSLEPVGTFKTNDGRKYFSDLLLGCTNDRFSVELTAPNGDEFLMMHAKSATLRQDYPVDRIYPYGLRSVAQHEDDLRVGLFGYLLKPHQGRSDALRFEIEQQPESGDWWSQFIELKVDLKQFGRSAHLLVLDPSLHQTKVPDEAQFVVISHDYRILPSELVFVPVPAHIAAKFS